MGSCKMRYCIYDGSIATINEINKDTAFIIDDYEQSVPVQQILIIPDRYELEIKAIKEQISSIKYRLNKLNEAYHNKSEALMEMYMTARDQEYKVINKLLRELKERKG